MSAGAESPLSRSRRPLRAGQLLLGLLAVAFPFLFHLAGDAQVHVAVAERFAAGEPFRYNPGGEIVVASTSPFWTLMLAAFYAFAGRYAPLLLQATVVLLWLAHTTIVANALGGLTHPAPGSAASTPLPAT